MDRLHFTMIVIGHLHWWPVIRRPNPASNRLDKAPSIIVEPRGEASVKLTSGINCQ